MINIFTKYYYGDQIKEDEIGGECGTYRGDEKCIETISWKS